MIRYVSLIKQFKQNVLDNVLNWVLGIVVFELLDMLLVDVLYLI